MESTHPMTALYESRIASVEARLTVLEHTTQQGDFLDVLRRALLMVVSSIDERRGYRTRGDGRRRFTVEEPRPAAAVLAQTLMEQTLMERTAEGGVSRR